MKIMFVCKHNLFRSKTAEAYFKQKNKNKNIKVSSGGIIPAFDLSRSPNQDVVLNEIGIKLEGEPQGINVNLLKEQDLVIVVANDLPKKVFDHREYVKKVIFWKVKDVLDNSKEKSVKTIKEIMKRVDALVEELENEK